MLRVIYFTSDQHFGHTNVIKYCNRPFQDVVEMNQELVRRHNVIVKAEDTVFHLGDFSMHPRAVAEFLPQLAGQHHLIMGNHDAIHPCNKRWTKKAGLLTRQYRDAGFLSVQLNMEFDAMGYGVQLNHMPYLSQEPGEHGLKHLDYRPKDQGAWLLHGHVHTQWKQRGRMINVGVDAWAYTPVSLPEIVELIKQGPQNL